MWKNEKFMWSKCWINPFFYSVRSVRWMIILKKKYIAIIVMLINVWQQIFLQIISVRILIRSIDYANRSQSVERETIK